LRTGLVVIDMLEDFVDGVLANPPAKTIIAPIASLLQMARRDPEWLVVYANDAHRPDDVELKVFPPHAMAGTPGAAVVAELRPVSGDAVVAKRFYSAFTRTDLGDILHREDIGRLVIVGQHTDCCVRHTTYDAFVRGFDLVVVADATTVFEQPSSEPTDLRQAGALQYLQYYYGARIEAAADLG
jgi:nicotinamidase-related amidase